MKNQSWQVHDVGTVFSGALREIQRELQGRAFTDSLAHYLSERKIEEFQRHLLNTCKFLVADEETGSNPVGDARDHFVFPTIRDWEIDNREAPLNKGIESLFSSFFI
jgi:hypothetical protein